MRLKRDTSDHTPWLNKKTTLALGKVMCDNVQIRKFLLEKFPDCFISKGIKFYSDTEDYEDFRLKLKDKLADEQELGGTISMIDAYYTSKMKLPQSILFCDKQIQDNELIDFLKGNNKISKICTDILLTSSNMIKHAKFELKKLIDAEVMISEASIYRCKSCKNLSFNKCTCKDIEEYKIYSFEENMWNYWHKSPEIFLEAMTAYVLKECEKYLGTSYYVCPIFADDSFKEEHELDFVSRDKKTVILCSKNSRDKREKGQKDFALFEATKVIFVSTEKTSPFGSDKRVIFMGDAKESLSFKETLSGIIKSVQ